MKVAVAILNYNGKSFLEKFLPSVCMYSKEASIYVIDNCSTDASVEFLKSAYPSVNLIQNESNGGFAEGYNEGLKHIEAEYYVLLNSDIEVTENWIKPCIDLLDSDKTIAALQPKILAEHEKDQFEHAGAAGGFLDKNFFPFCRGRIFSNVEKDIGQYNNNIEIFWATGACMFIRSKAYHEMNGLDSDFFAHMEEIDLCWRLKRSNKKIYYCGQSTVYHVGGGTLNYDSPRKTFLNFRNSLFMIFKNYEGLLFLKLAWRLILDGLAASIFLSKFQFKHFWSVYRAHMALYSNIGTLRRKRKELKASSTTFNNVGIYQKNITFKKFLSGVRNYSELSQDDFI